MTKRVLIIAPIDFNDCNNEGVIQKLIGQQQGFNKLGYQVDMVYNKGNTIYKNSEAMVITKRSYNRFRYYWYQDIKKLVSFEQYVFLWIRYSISTPSFISFLARGRHVHPKLKVILDMPTYPYADEWAGIRGRIALSMDSMYRSKLIRYVDRIAHSGPEKNIWQIPTTTMTNGVLTSQEILGRPIDTETIHLLAVGKWRYWHGLDRLVNTADFKSANMVLHIVGEGSALVDLNNNISQEQKEYVIYHGSMIGAKLIRLAEQCHMAIGTLGLHRKRVTVNSSLKHRDYCAKGLPFVYAGTDPDFDDQPFVLRITSDESPLHLDTLRSFYLNLDLKKMGSKMKAYSEQHLCWSNKIAPVLSAVMNT